MSKQKKPAKQAPKPARKTVTKLRQRIKSRKPDFVRPESWRYVRLKENWRRPKGIDNKVRKHVKGWPKSPRIGYRGPKTSRGLHPSGYAEATVWNVDELSEINPETTVVRIAHTVGMQKRREILVKARELNIRVLNAKVAKEAEKAIEETVEEEETTTTEEAELETKEETEATAKPEEPTEQAKEKTEEHAATEEKASGKPQKRARKRKQRLTESVEEQVET